MEFERGPRASTEGYSIRGSHAKSVALNCGGTLSGGNRFSVSGPVPAGSSGAAGWHRRVLDRGSARKELGFEWRRDLEWRKSLFCLRACPRRFLSRREAAQRCDECEHHGPENRITLPGEPRRSSQALVSGWHNG